MMMSQEPETQPWQQHALIEHSQTLLNSYRLYLGEDLISRDDSTEAQAQALFEAPFVVVSHGTQADPILNYGNGTALNLWQMDLDTLQQTPSRMTAEPVHRDERALLLERTLRDGFVDDYRGIRIASTGRRFLIEKAIVWNLVDDDGNRVGQAATFADWVFLDE